LIRQSAYGWHFGKSVCWLIMDHLVIRSYRFEDLPAIQAVQSAAMPMRAHSLHEYENDVTKLEERLRRNFIVAELNGVVVGAADYHRFAGSYHPHKFGLELFVNPIVEGRGVGRALFGAALTALQPLEPISLSVQVCEDEPRALQFAAQNDFLEVKRDFDSVLEVQQFETHAHRLGDNVRLVSWREADSFDRRREFHEVFEEVRLDVPRADTPTPLTFEFFEENILNDAETLPDVSFYGLREDRIIGFTGAFKGARDGWIDQWLTAVKREARGQGIATALKVKQIESAKALGFTHIRTDNDSRNAAMLAVNEKLGFQRQPAVLVMRKDFSQ
jgi:mycothiol synthase